MRPCLFVGMNVRADMHIHDVHTCINRACQHTESERDRDRDRERDRDRDRERDRDRDIDRERERLVRETRAHVDEAVVQLCGRGQGEGETTRKRESMPPSAR